MWHAMRFHCPEYFSGWDPLEKKNDEILSQGYEYMNTYISYFLFLECSKNNVLKLLFMLIKFSFLLSTGLLFLCQDMIDPEEKL